MSSATIFELLLLWAWKSHLLSLQSGRMLSISFFLLCVYALRSLWSFRGPCVNRPSAYPQLIGVHHPKHGFTTGKASPTSTVVWADSTPLFLWRNYLQTWLMKILCSYRLGLMHGLSGSPYHRCRKRGLHFLLAKPSISHWRFLSTVRCSFSVEISVLFSRQPEAAALLRCNLI